MELSKVKRDRLIGLSSNNKIKWTNRYECPPGYTFNEEGWVETRSPFPKISVIMLPYLLNSLGEYELLLQNLIALRLLNDFTHEDLELALKYRFKQAFFGRAVKHEVFDAVVKKSRTITDTADLPELCSDILKFDSIWYSRFALVKNTSSIKKRLKINYISSIRDLMPINKKYITKEVMSEAELTKYAVNTYWKTIGLNAKNRSISAISEAVSEISDIGQELTQKTLSEVAGVSVRSIQRYKETWYLKA